MKQQHRPFRFGLLAHNTSLSKGWLIDQARKTEDLGYATFLVPDHLGDVFSPALALAQVASVTKSLRVGSCVFDNDFRHPVLLAKDVATLDVLTDGRLEFGLGAGWMQSEYEQIGLTFDRPGVRIARMVEGIRIIKGLLTQEQVTFAGQYYQVKEMPGLPRPVQQPHPPILMGGSGKRMLTLAAQEATIISLVPKLHSAVRGEHMNDLLNTSDITPEAIAEKISWVQEAAGTRFAQLELSMVVSDVKVSDQEEVTLHACADRFGLSVEQVRETPYLLVGSVETIREKLWMIREQYGISYFMVWEEHLSQLAPIVARLAGQ